MKRSNSSTSLPRKGSLEDILNMFPDEDDDEHPNEDLINNPLFTSKFNQWNQQQQNGTSSTPTNNPSQPPNNYNQPDERSYLVKSESMTSLSSFGEVMDGLSSPLRPHPMQPRHDSLIKSASSTSLTDYVDSSTLLKSSSSSSLTNLHASSLLNKSFSSSSFSRFQEEMEDDEDYNRKYHASSSHHIGLAPIEDNNNNNHTNHQLYHQLPPMPQPPHDHQETPDMQQMRHLIQSAFAPTPVHNHATNIPPNENQEPQQPSPSPTNIQQRMTVQYGNETYTSIDGKLYNDRGYKICGHLNQHSRPCQRIGRCPFHDKLRGDEEDGGEDQIDVAEKKKIDPHIIQISTSENDSPNIGSSQPVKKVPFKQGWNKDEHMRFLTGLQTYGKGAWKEIATIVGTRTPTQIQSHAQKYFLRQKQKNKNKRSIHDFTMDDMNKMMATEDNAADVPVDEQMTPIKKRKGKAATGSRKRKNKQIEEEEEEAQQVHHDEIEQEHGANSDPMVHQVPQLPQNGMEQGQMQQFIQSHLSHLFTNGNIDPNQLLTSYASLAMLLQSKMGELYQQGAVQQQAPGQPPIFQQIMQQNVVQPPENQEQRDEDEPHFDVPSKKRQRFTS